VILLTGFLLSQSQRNNNTNVVIILKNKKLKELGLLKKKWKNSLSGIIMILLKELKKE
jgi:hypothetical protein